MIMLADWHPDIIEFIISKVQNPHILRHLIATTKDEQIRQLAKEKLKFEPLSAEDRKILEVTYSTVEALKEFDEIELFKKHNPILQVVEDRLKEGGHYTVNNPDFLTGANISVAITKEFMQAVENDEEYELRFPDIENYDEEQMRYYNEHWHEIGDVREWPLPVKVYRKIRARDLWELICTCATYSAEPGIFFIDNANKMTNAVAYGQKVVATNP